MAKNKGKDSEKRRSKAKQEKKKKRALRLVKSRPNPNPQIISRPGLPHMGAPEGFRSVPFSQAMMEYAKPLMKFPQEDMDELNGIMQISTALWNYSLSVEEGKEDKKIAKTIIKDFRRTFGLDKEKAEALLTEMLERRSYLFPKDVQPEPGTPFMFIRKEVQHLIRPFDYGRITLSFEIIPPDQADNDLINKIRKLDGYVQDALDYGEYEDLFLSLQDDCEERFKKWLVAKGLKEDAQNFSFCIPIYLSFLYGYAHDDILVLKSIPDIYFVEFFEDFFLRKMMVEPNEYANCPPALKLFYQFLYEKGYLKNQEEIIQKIDNVEPYFIEVLRKQFS